MCFIYLILFYMNEKEDLKDLETLGLDIAENAPPESIDIITAKFHYYGNRGYYHLSCNSKGELLILKGIFNDQIRILDGDKWDIKNISTIIGDTLYKIEKHYKTCMIVYFYVTNQNLVKFVDIKNDNLIFDQYSIKIDKPLSNPEYMSYRNKEISDDTLYYDIMDLSLLPESISYFLRSLILKYPDMLNDFFVDMGFYTHSPSLKLIANRLFFNFDSMESIFRTLKSGMDFEIYNHIPSFYLKNIYKNFTPIRSKILFHNTPGINKEISEIDEMINHINLEFIFRGNFLNLLRLFIKLHIKIYIKLCENFIKLSKLVKDADKALELIYKTRESSFFYSKNHFEMPLFFDINQSIVTFSPVISSSPEKINTVLEDIPLIRKFIFLSRIKKFSKGIHKLLCHRDELILLASKTIIKINKALNPHDKEVGPINKNYLGFYEYDDLKRIFNGGYKDNLADTVRSRKWQSDRLKVQLVPKMIYEKDIEDLYLISNKLIDKYEKIKEIPCISFFHRNNKKLRASVFKDNNICKNTALIVDNIPLSKFDLLRHVEAIIIEKIPSFSYLMEFAAINGLPVYTGIPFAHVLDNREVILTKDKIIVSG